MGRLRKPKHKTESAIKKTQRTLDVDLGGYISFSFKYLKVCDKFDPYGKGVDYFSALLARKVELCKQKPNFLLSNRSPSLRCHPIDWDNVTEDSFGIKAEGQLVNKPYQFSLSSNEYGRVHGFFIKSVFYVVWLDPEHNLYSRR